MSASTTVEKAVGAIDDRLTSSNFLKRSLNKVFPDHWSFMLGEIALYSFIILLLSGVFLTFFFIPSMNEVTYNGGYDLMRGVRMSEAFQSTLNISFDVRGGLLVRQIHHWAALLFVAAMAVHSLRVFFTGAFRKPRELNWIIGVGLLSMGLAEGFAGYSLPDDLLSGTGLRIAEGIMLAIPVVGSYVAFFVFGGEFPGHVFISRLYTVHVLLVPGIILALITAHLMMVWYQKHTQYPGPGRTNGNVVGYPFMPVYMAKSGGFFFIVFGVVALLGAFVSINPIWEYGPYNPSQVTAGSQPDWYIGWLEGALRIMPGVETRLWGHTISWNILIPGVIIPGLVFTGMALYPFLEQWVTGDKREHHLLDRPRNAAVRTAIGAMAVTFYTLLWIGGANDLIAVRFGLSFNEITWFLRVAVIIGPPIAFAVTKRVALALQQHDRDLVLHGHETGHVFQLQNGEYVEGHRPVSPEEAWLLAGHEVHRPIELPQGTDANGIPRPRSRGERLRARLSHWYFGDRVEPPTAQEIAAAAVHGEHEALAPAPEVRQLQTSSAEGESPASAGQGAPGGGE